MMEQYFTVHTKNLLETINKYRKVAGYKINRQKFAFLCTNNKISERNEENLIYNYNKKNKIYRNKLKREDLYTENYTILLKEIEAGIKKQEDILCS